MKAKKNKDFFRSDCPISSALDFFGDKWSLLLVRDMVYFGARTFKEFSEAAEGISSARLSDRLTKLESLGILTKKRHRSNKKVYLYQLTKKGYDLFPFIADLVLWRYKHLNHHISDAAKQFANMLEDDREGTLNLFMDK